MPADRSAALVSPAEGTDAADADRGRFVFGADPARDRWWGRPLAETRWCLELGRLLYPDVEDVVKPKERAECGNGERPCPFVSCKHHLYLDVSAKTGAIKLNFPDL